MGTRVLADRGFDLADDLAVHGTSLVKSQFTERKQLPQREAKTARTLSNV